MSMMKPAGESRVRSRLDDDRWDAVSRRDRQADGLFVYAVKTTGVYCRPSCAAKRALRKNVRFFAAAEEAERAGFRACKRCQPRLNASFTLHASAIATACRLIAGAAKSPGVAALAQAAGMSPSHFQRVFKSVTGMTPAAYTSANRAERMRRALSNGARPTAAVYSVGYGSTSRFYERATEVLGMSTARYRAGGRGERVLFAVGACSLGHVLVAATQRGVCAISMGDDPGALVQELERRFNHAELVGGDGAFDELVGRVMVFVEQPAKGLDLPLDIRGTAFQHRVWQALRKIPAGATRSYSEVAEAIGSASSQRAVAAVCGANTVAVAIPCHRVVRRDRSISGYRWGVERKMRLIEAERRD